MSDDANPYCLVTTDGNWEAATPLSSFDELVAHLREAYDAAANEMADQRAAQDQPEVRDLVPVGGFGVCLRNRSSGEVEVGIGREVWFLFRHHPQPRRCYSDNPPVEGYLAFYLDGGHHTELRRDMLVSRPAGLSALRRWLDTGEFPD